MPSLHSHKAEVTRVHTQSTEAIVAPKACPLCKSADITTTSKAMNVSTYWRSRSALEP